MMPFLDSKKKPYIHLVDGGVADNLGLRAVLERVTLMGDPWTTLKYAAMENVHKIVFVVVNAETEIDDKWDRYEKVPPFGAMLDSYSSIAIARYNMETVALLSESFTRWADEIRKGRCGSGPISTEPGSCGDIEFYLVEVRFDALDDEAERSYPEAPSHFIRFETGTGGPTAGCRPSHPHQVQGIPTVAPRPAIRASSMPGGCWKAPAASSTAGLQVEYRHVLVRFLHIFGMWGGFSILNSKRGLCCRRSLGS